MVRLFTIERNTNNHHILYPRRLYIKTIQPKHLRNHPAMQIELPVSLHNELHANVPPNPIMTGELAKRALRMLTQMPQDFKSGDMFYELNRRFGDVARTMGKLAMEAGMFHEQFDEQIKFIERRHDV